MSKMHEIKLTALDGSNLLGFLAALGTLRMLNAAGQKVSLSWNYDKGSGRWEPTLHTDRADLQVCSILQEKLLATSPTEDQIKAEKRLRTECKGARKQFEKQECAKQNWLEKEKEWTSKLGSLPFPRFLSTYSQFSMPNWCFRSTAKNAIDTKDGQLLAFLSSFCTDMLLNEGDLCSESSLQNLRNMRDDIKPSIFHYIQSLSVDTNAEDLAEALFDGWSYLHGREYSLRWDSSAVPRYALQSAKPSEKDGVCVRAANLLAFHALPFFPCMVNDQNLITSSFSRSRLPSDITWAIWTTPLVIDEIKSILSIHYIHHSDPNITILRSAGISEVFRSTRQMDGKYYKKFSPPCPLF